ncbi:MAG: DUF547 domain-containing protein [Pirellulales bacterium]|nr:DUF547 domain-containing protein [Pirellulales bacterium]
MSMSKKEYSGPFLWLALASFLMPVGVALWAFKAVPRPYTYAEIQPDASGVDNGLWDQLLRNYVADGLVDYDGMKRDHHFKTYIAQLAVAKPEMLPDDDHRLALLCNAYNAFVINGVITHKIDDNVLNYQSNSGKGFFDLQEHILAGETIDLNHLEHEVIRPTYKEPRIHVALVCAAKSCPAIRPEAYVGKRLRQQLEDQTKLFAENPTYVRYAPQEKKIYLSPILKWYAEDFGGPPGVIDFLLQRVQSAEEKQGLELAKEGTVELAYNTYDWTLNTQGKIGGGGAAKSTGFGSGSIPNE